MNMSKFRDIQAKMPSPKVMAFWLVTVKVLNSYEYDGFFLCRRPTVETILFI